MELLEFDTGLSEEKGPLEEELLLLLLLLALTLPLSEEGLLLELISVVFIFHI